MSLAPLVAQILLDSFARPRKKPARMLKTELAIFSLAGFLSLMGAVLLIYALYAEISVYYPPPVAALIAGVFLYVLAILVVVTGKLIIQKKKRRYVDESPVPTIEDNIKLVTTLIESALGLVKQEVGEPVRENPATSMLVASVAGFLAARFVR